MRSLSVNCWYESRSDAEAAESAAIKAEGPKYNKKHAAPAGIRREIGCHATLGFYVVDGGTARERPWVAGGVGFPELHGLLAAGVIYLDDEGRIRKQTG